MQQTMSGDGNSNTERVHGGKLHVHLSGTISGTAKLQFKGDDGSWLDINGASWTAATDQVVELGSETNYTVRINLAGSSSPSMVVVLRG